MCVTWKHMIREISRNKREVISLEQEEKKSNERKKIIVGLNESRQEHIYFYFLNICVAESLFAMYRSMSYVVFTWNNTKCYTVSIYPFLLYVWWLISTWECGNNCTRKLIFCMKFIYTHKRTTTKKMKWKTTFDSNLNNLFTQRARKSKKKLHMIETQSSQS